MPTLSRRTLLGITSSTALASVLPAVRMAASPPHPRPCPATDWQKHGVILTGESDDRWVQSFTSPPEALGEGRWRLWCSQSGNPKAFNIGYAEGTPGQPLSRRMAVLSTGEPANEPLALGNLPADWRPVQVIHLQLRNGRHRLYFWAHGPKVVRYLAAESDDGRRYRVLDPLRPCLYHPADRAVDGAAAAQIGLNRWSKKKATVTDGEPLAPANLISNDATNVYQLPDGSFEMYSVTLVEVPKGDPSYIAEDNVAGMLRVVDRYTSDDGLHWTNRRRVLQRDADDPADMQFYYLAVTHTPQGRTGMLGHYRCQAQTMDIEWCYSTDGVVWQRPARRPWLERGKPGEPDCLGVYAPHFLVADAGRWHLFYTGTNATHNRKLAYGQHRQVVMHATCANPWAT